MRIILLLSACCLIMTSLPVSGGDRVTGQAFATRSEVIARHGMAATSQPLVTQIALDVLKAGGNAVDAAIAANAAQGLMEPVGNGIGGDLFAIVWDAESQALYGLNASGRSPRSLSLQWFADQGYETIPSYGPLPVSVPGCVDGWFELHARFGSRPMAELLDPAIRYAREGFPVTELIAYYWDRSVPRLSQFPGFTKQFTVDGRAPRKGEIWRNPFLANTLARIAGGGRDAFYEGAVAKTIADYVQAQGGFLSEADLAAHTSEWVEPVSTDYRGYRVWELPPNTQGVAALQMLNILEGFDLAAAGFGSPDHLHWFTEAKKLAFEDRARYYTDPDFADIPLERLLSKWYAAEQRARIDKGKAAKAYPDPASLQSGDTIYLTVADEAGNMVSLIQSNYRGMGSGMTPPGLGFILQNRGELFALDPTHANRFEPGKRPFHTIIPAFITHDGAPWVSFGLMGGAMQPQGHVQIVTNLIDFGMNLQEAGDAPRLYHEGSSSPTGPVMSDGGQLYLESGFDYSTVRALMGRGHRIGSARGPYGGYQAILRDPVSGVYFGASESRKDGQAAGY
ncbi:MAG: gamma-glutamyltransferase [Xanthomonadales bacterium]|nr:gamma-glutamyltransferase [Xanthomonadales bacterium]